MSKKKLEYLFEPYVKKEFWNFIYKFNLDYKINIQIINTSSLKRCPRAKLESIVRNVLIGENRPDANITVILVNDDYIHELNRKFLTHDYPTDVITFDMDDEDLDSEIYISTDTAARQAIEYDVTLNEELLRLAAHGTLHICGYNDGTDLDREKMHDLEDKYLRMI